MLFDGARLRELRRRRALSLRDLGKLANVSYDGIHAAEAGKREPRPSTVRKLATALGVDTEAFFSDGGTKDRPRD
jgi:transcriptional regulator with XRE-family HTH domain